jgi:hypothetical protein
MRGRLFLAGVDDRTPITDVCDVLTVVVMDTPGEALGKWRAGLDRAATTARAAAMRSAAPAAAQAVRAATRASWGLSPEQIASTQRFHATLEGRS